MRPSNHLVRQYLHDLAVILFVGWLAFGTPLRMDWAGEYHLHADGSIDSERHKTARTVYSSLATEGQFARVSLVPGDYVQALVAGISTVASISLLAGIVWTKALRCIDRTVLPLLQPPNGS